MKPKASCPRRLSPRELEVYHRLLMESPRNRVLEFLIVLAVLFWFPQFWLAERIVWKHEQQRR